MVWHGTELLNFYNVNSSRSILGCAVQCQIGPALRCMPARPGTTQHKSLQKITTARKMAAWTDNETFKLIEIWGDETIQEQLEGCKRNKDVYEKISKFMFEAGYDRTGTQCREKIKKLKVDYRKVKDKNKQTGNNQKDTKFYNALNEILDNKPTTQPPILIDSSAEYPADVSAILDDDEGNHESPFTDNTVEESGVSAANTSGKEDSADRDADVSEDTSVTEQSDVKPLLVQNERRTLNWIRSRRQWIKYVSELQRVK